MAISVQKVMLLGTLHTGLVCTSFGSFGGTVCIATSPGTLLVLPILILLFLLVPQLSVLILIFLILLYILPKHCYLFFIF